ncbi:hypothetical protein CA850_20875 [Micromonospora echinospora]|uniref:DUF397 domain-containing protein n=1 Tax=Micromonospora echinospora TaxID=1877 RepID=A0A1C4WF67_MICEC|nr:DUF397 domain-containing protein [Micromonospora echinospora]OZV77862.1 hypothetical protein CA850_20875 [Micromonospora echinospora]SCE94896.1 protein of unknown function [Micromonospora echinospora]
MSSVGFAGATWRKSSVSGDTGCVEAAFVEEEVGVRDSKLSDDSSVLVFTRHEWAVFLHGVGKGEFGRPAA